MIGEQYIGSKTEEFVSSSVRNLTSYLEYRHALKIPNTSFCSYINWLVALPGYFLTREFSIHKVIKIHNCHVVQTYRTMVEAEGRSVHLSTGGREKLSFNTFNYEE